MEAVFEKQTFIKKLTSMLKVDFKRLITMPLVYIMAGVGFVIPILILVMTSMTGGTSIDPVTGVEIPTESFTSVWQAISSVSGTQTSMDIMGMCNINMMYFLIAIFVCIFVADDFKSGYVKNLFTVRSKRIDYCVSKTVVGFVGGAAMILAYFIGAMLGGVIGGLSFDAGAVGAGEIASCLVAKIFTVFVFVSVALVLSVAGKQKLWISIVGSLCACMLMFTMLPMISPLDSGFLNVIMCLIGGVLFAFGFGAIANVILKKTSLV